MKEINKLSLKSILIKEDLLCHKCRKELEIKRNIEIINDIEIESYFKYEGMFKTLLLQYKECFDEALSDIFLYDLSEYIRLRYWNYHIVYIPSSKEKLRQRGFDHLRGIFKQLNMKEAGILIQKKDLHQQNKNLKEREKMKNNYIYEGKKVKKILLVDDVLTSGSSIIGAHNSLKGNYEKIKTIVLARK